MAGLGSSSSNHSSYGSAPVWIGMSWNVGQSLNVLAHSDGMEGAVIGCGAMRVLLKCFHTSSVANTGMCRNGWHWFNLDFEHHSYVCGPLRFGFSFWNVGQSVNGSSTCFWHGRWCDAMRVLLWNYYHASSKANTGMGSNDLPWFIDNYKHPSYVCGPLLRFGCLLKCWAICEWF